MKFDVKFEEKSRQISISFEEKSRQISTSFGEIQKVSDGGYDRGYEKGYKDGQEAGMQPYLGEYEATPKVNAQTLETASKFMTKDVVIKAIPYFEVSNTSGGNTIYIGEELG